MNNSTPMVDRIRLALRGDDRCSLVRECLSDGCTLHDVRSAVEGTDFRFLLLRNGSDIEVVSVNELRLELSRSINLLRAAADLLVIQDMKAPSQDEQARQAFIRGKVAEAARNAELVRLRIGRFMLSCDDFDDDAEEKILADAGFTWDGGPTVQEIWSNEHQQRLDALYAATENGHSLHLTTVN